MVDGAKSHIPSQWASLVSSWQYVAEHCLSMGQNDSWWVRDQVNMVDGLKSHIPSQWTSAESSWQHVAKHCHETKLWPSLLIKLITFFPVHD